MLTLQTFSRELKFIYSLMHLVIQQFDVPKSWQLLNVIRGRMEPHSAYTVTLCQRVNRAAHRLTRLTDLQAL